MYINNGWICATSYSFGKGQTNKRKRGIITFLDKQGRRDSNPRQQFTTNIERRCRASWRRPNKGGCERSRGEESRQRVEENAASRIEHPPCRTGNVISASLRFYNHPVTPSLCRPLQRFRGWRKRKNCDKQGWVGGGILCRNPAWIRSFGHRGLSFFYYYHLDRHWETDTRFEPFHTLINVAEETEISSVEYFIRALQYLLTLESNREMKNPMYNNVLGKLLNCREIKKRKKWK